MVRNDDPRFDVDPGFAHEPQVRVAPRADQPAWMSQPVEERRRKFALGVATVGVLSAATIGAFVIGDDDSPSIVTTEAPVPVETVVAPQVAAAAVVAQPDIALVSDEEESVDVEGTPARADGGCTIGALSLRLGASGDGVTCLQNALIDAGYTLTASGQFDDVTLRVVMDYQTAEDLFVDGVVGRESALALDIWPDEESFVVRTPAPAPGAKDLWGVELSPVASAGSTAPPLPDNAGQGEGRRIVYDRAGQRVWAVSDDERIIRSWLISGSTYQNELPGRHEVYSRSEMSTAWNGKAWLPQMVRWLKTERGAIGFHAIPLHVEDNSPYQGTEELGTRLSGGCQRQHNLDAAFMWEFATIGTPVIVT